MVLEQNLNSLLQSLHLKTLTKEHHVILVTESAETLNYEHNNNYLWSIFPPTLYSIIYSAVFLSRIQK